MPELHVIAAGSLLEIALEGAGISFPVGRVSFLYMYPMTFKEFLMALGHEMLVEWIENFDGKLPAEALHNKLLSLLKEYFLVGGMPEAIREYIFK